MEIAQMGQTTQQGPGECKGEEKARGLELEWSE